MNSKRTSAHWMQIAATLVLAMSLSGWQASAADLNPCAAKTLNPCAAKTLNPCAAKTLNPCAAKTLNPCAAKTLNPCAAKTLNPCAAKTLNPCAAKTLNPCAAKTLNPCAAKTLNPCAAKTLNPCAAKALNPCSAKRLNPCAGKSNPCSAKANPCNPCGAGNPCNPCAGAPIDAARFQQSAAEKLALRAKLAVGRKALVTEGEQLWNDRELGKSGVACATCHYDNYGQMQSTFAEPYPHYVAMPHQRSGVSEVTAAEMVNFCMIVPMMGEPLEDDSRELAALTAYVENIRPGFKAAANPCNPCGAVGNPGNPCGAKRNPCGY